MSGAFKYRVKPHHFEHIDETEKEIINDSVEIDVYTTGEHLFFPVKEVSQVSVPNVYIVNKAHFLQVLDKLSSDPLDFHIGYEDTEAIYEISEFYIGNESRQYKRSTSFVSEDRLKKIFQVSHVELVNAF